MKHTLFFGHLWGVEPLHMAERNVLTGKLTCKLEKKRTYATGDSQVVTNPSTNPAHTRLTSEF